MSYQTYKLIHLTGVLMVFLSLGGLIGRALLEDKGTSLKKFAGMTNGIGLILALVGGFGLVAKLGYAFRGWVIAKLILWLVFGVMIAVVNRKPQHARVLWWVVIGLGGLAAYLAGSKPF